jgi:hypothetical protein
MNCFQTLLSHFNEWRYFSVDPKKADYAVITGIQIHSYGHSADVWHPNMEYVCPTSMYVVTGGQRIDIDLLEQAEVRSTHY